MKGKSFIAALLLLLAGVQTTWAQSVIVNMKDEGTSVFNLSEVESISFSESDFADGFEYVDLGLPSGTLWATCNVGAESPEEFGDYFAWGETNRKWEYSWAMYQYIIGDNPNALTRYCNQSEYGYQGLMDGITELLQEDDAATAYWGNKWQTPDVNQFKELFNEKYTTSEWTTLNGKNVRKITSKSNGMSIVLPAAGYREDMGIHFSENYGYYWSRSLGTNNPTTAFQLFFNSDEVTTYGSFRYLGLSVRPVCVKKKMREHEYVDLGLPSGTLWATTNVGADSPEEYGDYFAWGETEPKDEYSWSTYFDTEDNGSTFKKYNKDGGLTELLPTDDAATVNWGSDWQMPTVEQLVELYNVNYTTIEWTTLNGVYGPKITSKSNGKSIFLPAAGHLNGTSFVCYEGTEGSCLSRSLSTFSNCAYGLNFYSTNIGVGNDTRSYGGSVRPVRKQEPKEHEYVDLGLPSGTLWATTNIGAASPEEYGDYFAWGETEPKDEYNWSTYKYCENGNSLMTTKYRVNSPGGTIDNKTVLDPEDDAATANWGLDWQMPSQEQLKELFNGSFTSSVNTTLNNVEGVLVTSLTNGNSIFLPKAGRYNGVNYYADGGSFWSRNLDLSDSYDRKALHTWVSDAVNYGPYERYQGLSIRPVRRQEVQGHEYVDLGLPSGTLWATTNIGADSPEDYGDYFAWGETKPKDEYNWSTYFDTKDYGRTFEKYNTDGKTKLLPEDDAATANWGSDWQMPTYDQMRELVNSSYTTSEWTTVNGVEGRKITSRINGKSIFLPAEGIRHESGLLYAGSYGLYWSRSLLTDNSSQAHYLDFDSDDFREDMNFCNRDYGQCIRPVVKK